MREALSQAIKDAMKKGDKPRLGTLRLISAAIKDRDLGIGTSGAPPVGGQASPEELMAVLTRMVKQRRESAITYRSAGRNDLAIQEEAEVKVIEEFLPKQLSEADISKIVDDIATELGASTPKDMGTVMAALKSRYAGQMDFAKASAVVKDRLKS